MTTTPTLWGTEATVTFDIFAFGPQVATFADGAFAIVWENGTDIFGRHLSELGGFTGGDFLSAVSAATTKPLSGPNIFQQTDGRVVVNYRLQYDDAPQDFDVLWHSPDFTTPYSSSFGTEPSPYDEILLDSAPRAAGGAAIVYRYSGPGDASYLVLRFTDAVGNQASNQIFIDPGSDRDEQNPALARVGFSSNIMVAYESVDQTTFARDVRLHIYAPDGTDLSGDVIVSASNVSAGFPDVVTLEGAGEFITVVAWQQADGIAFRRYFGNLPLDPTPLLVPDSLGFQPKIAALKDGGFIIAWTAIVGTESDGSPELDVFLRRFNVNGNTIGTTVRIDEPGDQGFGSLIGKSIATLPDGRVVLAYESETGDSTNITTLNYQIFDPRENTIYGTSGNDNFVGREEPSVISGFAGDDKLTGREGDDALNGGAGSDTLIGGGGNDTLNGGTNIVQFGGDTMRGGVGDDFYFVDSISDIVVEAPGEGTDRVFASTSYSLPGGLGGFIEKLTTTNNDGTGAINLTGNNIANIIYGNVGSNILDGKGAADILVGLGGDDFYVVDNAGDAVVEGAGQGAADRVLAGADYALGPGQQIEKLTTTDNAGTAPLNLTGNDLANIIYGNAGSNALKGLAGNDTLIGLGGSDAFVFNTALNGSNNVDLIGDFSPSDDDIILASGIFPTIALGTLSPSAFVTGPVALDAADRIIYNSATGSLLYDPAGTAGGTAVQFATLTAGLALTNADFIVV